LSKARKYFFLIDTEVSTEGALRAFRLERLTGAIARIPHSRTQQPKAERETSGRV